MPDVVTTKCYMITGEQGTKRRICAGSCEDAIKTWVELGTGEQIAKTEKLDRDTVLVKAWVD